MLSHVDLPFFMSVEKFAQCANALADFPTNSLPSKADPHKMVGIIGGEPLLHPDFDQLARILADAIPNREHRGLWTGLDWRRTKHANLIEKTFGYINHNMHQTECRHSPVLVAIQDVVPDKAKQKEMIDNCWLQRLWSASCTPKGFFFCEVAAAMDMVFEGPGGLPIEPGCWDRPLSDFQSQIDRWCSRCGIPLNLKGRLDSEEMDDISESNLEALRNSPRIKSGNYVLHESVAETDREPWRYLR
jgi:hypothetical protein